MRHKRGSLKTEAQKRRAIRDAVRRHRERKRLGIPSKYRTKVKDKEIESLPLSLKMMVVAGTNARRVLGMKANTREREELAVRRFRGY